MAANLRLLWMTFWVGMALTLAGGGAFVSRVTASPRAELISTSVQIRSLHEIRGID